MKQHHKIEVFSANCPLCKQVTEEIQIGKCEGCTQIVYDLNQLNENTKSKMKEYDVKAVPTTIIDGIIKVVGVPKFPWICDETLYERLKREYPLRKV